jgi:hypothetical protein
MNFDRWKIRLKLRWEYFLLHRDFKNQEKFNDHIRAYFEKKGWRDAGTFHGSLEDMKKEIVSEYANLQKVIKDE